MTITAASSANNRDIGSSSPQMLIVLVTKDNACLKEQSNPDVDTLPSLPWSGRRCAPAQYRTALTPSCKRLIPETEPANTDAKLWQPYLQPPILQSPSSTVTRLSLSVMLCVHILKAAQLVFPPCQGWSFDFGAGNADLALLLY